MATIILIFGCYIFLTIILMGIYLMIDGGEFFQKIIMLLWGSFPFICGITMLLLIIV